MKKINRVIGLDTTPGPENPGCRAKLSTIKILHICDSFNMGGLENGIINIINGSDNTETSHEICCIRQSGAAATRLNKPIYIWEINKAPDTTWGHFNQLVRVIKERQPDIVHTRNWGAIDGVIAARIAGVKVVIHGEHGWNIADPGGMNQKRRLARRVLSPFIDKYIAVSDDIRQWLESSCSISSKKIVKIINGVDTQKFHPDGEKAKIRFQLGLSDEIVIGAAGRLDPIKKFDILVEAFSVLKMNHEKIKLIIAGDGSESKNIRKKVAEKGVFKDVLLLGERHDLQEIYKIMDIFVLPSLNEGISNTILEAMATGLPVIATRVGGNCELIEHNYTGMLIEPDSVGSLVNALNYYLNNSEIAEQHRKKARMNALSCFSLQAMLDNYNNLYRFYGRK